ncbi:MAG TPA: adenosine deaminase [Acidobacteriota bacterium]|nr:adenosine deaminase [Acidobacteriota bacterium]HQM64158.1 adenosine deaminase [Acidobacteriota bacterium]
MTGREAGGAGRTPAVNWRAAPKAETHVHLEGSVDATLLQALHRRHGLPWAERPPESIRAELAFSDFHGFLDAYKAVVQAIRCEEDFRDITAAFFGRLQRDGVVHCEFFHTPAACMKYGLDPDRALAVILETAADEGRTRGISWGVVLDNVRQFPEEFFHRTLELACRHQDRGVVGIGVGGDETAAPLEPLAPAFLAARERGLRISLHTGETGSAESMLRDLRAARPHRIGHGLPAGRSERVAELVAALGAVIDVCPTSNMATKVVPDLAVHPLRTMYAWGVPMTVATDDPALFQTDLVREYELVAELISDAGLAGRLARWQTANPLLPERARRQFAEFFNPDSRPHGGDGDISGW